MNRLEIEFLSDFGELDVVLFRGEKESLLRFVDHMHSLSRGETPAFDLHTLQDVKIYGDLSLVLKVDSIEKGLRKKDWRLPNLAFVWQLSPEGWLEIAEKTLYVAVSEMPCHAYLSSPIALDDVLPMVSKWEYPTGSLNEQTTGKV